MGEAVARAERLVLARPGVGGAGLEGEGGGARAGGEPASLEL